MKTLLTLAITLAFTASAFSAEKKAPCCAADAGKTECSQIYAKLNLTPEQHSKLDSFQARCEKDGCREESMKKFMHEAKSVLTPEQFAQLKSECGKMEKHG
jgi:Spy/CpxP family protein refolding chaperone